MNCVPIAFDLYNRKINRYFMDKKDVLKYILIPWFLFTILYWTASLYKGFHIDEFFSWVYTQRSSVTEIFQLKDFGIGHPPIYHFLQKIIQTIFTNYHPFQVRVINYLVGSFFIVLLIRLVSKHRENLLFLYSLCFYATILDIFLSPAFI